MSRDDALSWGGDDDPTLDVGSRPAPEPEPAPGREAAPPALPLGFTAVGRGSDEVGRIEADGTVTLPGEPAPLSNAVLVSLGILGGAYALFTVGGIIGGLRLQGTAQFLVSPVGYRFAFWLAVVAPALWFLTAYVLTRGAKAWVRLVWLIGGLALLIPWPFMFVGAVGQ
ncbi:DNA polymerase III subunit gamma/tau [Microbacterium sp.]|uniref:DNA polymerase III subunit gamma/tau n=1 Tax=Microbacterium sp. TaxID=51671 RepID=UPI003C723BDC